MFNKKTHLRLREFPFHSIVIFCRSIKDAKKVHRVWFNRGYNPKNRDIKIDDKGRIILLNKFSSFNIKNFWISCGYFPILRDGGRTKFFNKNKYDKMIPNCVRFIKDLAKEN